jgi:hypothetical protein
MQRIYNITVACLLKARIGKPADTGVAREQLCKHMKDLI